MATEEKDINDVRCTICGLIQPCLCDKAKEFYAGDSARRRSLETEPLVILNRRRAKRQLSYPPPGEMWTDKSVMRAIMHPNSIQKLRWHDLSPKSLNKNKMTCRLLLRSQVCDRVCIENKTKQISKLERDKVDKNKSGLQTGQECLNISDSKIIFTGFHVKQACNSATYNWLPM